LILDSVKKHHIFYKVFLFIISICIWINLISILMRLLNLWEGEEEECFSILTWWKEWEGKILLTIEILLILSDKLNIVVDEFKDTLLQIHFYLHKAPQKIQSEMVNKIHNSQMELSNNNSKMELWTEFNSTCKIQMVEILILMLNYLKYWRISVCHKDNS